MNERANERTSERANEQTNERTNEFDKSFDKDSADFPATTLNAALLLAQRLRR